MIKALLIIIGSLVAMLLIVTVGYIVTYNIMLVAPQENNTRVLKAVDAVCDYGHDHTDANSEEACGVALNASNTEYKCKQYAKDSSDCYATEN